MKIFLFLLLICTPTFAADKLLPQNAESLKRGKKSYETNCLACHGDKGDGMGPAGAMLNPKPRHLVKDKYKNGDKPEEIFASITKGLAGTTMAGFSHLSKEDRSAITYYVLSLRKKSK